MSLQLFHVPAFRLRPALCQASGSAKSPWNLFAPPLHLKKRFLNGCRWHRFRCGHARSMSAYVLSHDQPATPTLSEHERGHRAGTTIEVHALLPQSDMLHQYANVTEHLRVLTTFLHA